MHENMYIHVLSICSVISKCSVTLMVKFECSAHLRSVVL